MSHARSLAFFALMVTMFMALADVVRADSAALEAEVRRRAAAVAASSDDLEITVIGRQGHGGMPWNTIGPVTTSALVVGARTMAALAVNFLASPPAHKERLPSACPFVHDQE